MIEVRAATADEMVLAFLQGDAETAAPDRKISYAQAIRMTGMDRATLYGDRADLFDQRQNDARRFVLGVRGYGRNDALFTDFPADTDWRRFKVTSDEIRGFKYVSRVKVWERVSGGTRLVRDGVENLEKAGNEEIRVKVTGIADRLHKGDRFPLLIAVKCSGSAEVILMEGHHRATAYALTGLPEEIEVIVGSSAHMRSWPFFGYNSPAA